MTRARRKYQKALSYCFFVSVFSFFSNFSDNLRQLNTTRIMVCNISFEAAQYIDNETERSISYSSFLQLLFLLIAVENGKNEKQFFLLSSFLFCLHIFVISVNLIICPWRLAASKLKRGKFLCLFYQILIFKHNFKD